MSELGEDLATEVKLKQRRSMMRSYESSNKVMDMDMDYEKQKLNILKSKRPRQIVSQHQYITVLDYGQNETQVLENGQSSAMGTDGQYQL